MTGAKVGVVITDSHGRPFRLGQTGVAIGVAGIPALLDRRGDTDLFGYTLKVSEIAVADEIAATADLLMGPGAEGIPVVHIRGLSLPDQAGKAADLVVWSTDPLSVYALADLVFIDGHLYYDRSDPARQPASDFSLGTAP